VHGILGVKARSGKLVPDHRTALHTSSHDRFRFKQSIGSGRLQGFINPDNAAIPGTDRNLYL
jgi:hypothetical protein